MGSGVMVIEVEQEEDGRWVGSVEGCPGALAYGLTPEEAVEAAIVVARTAGRMAPISRRIRALRGLFAGLRAAMACWAVSLWILAASLAVRGHHQDALANGLLGVVWWVAWWAARRPPGISGLLDYAVWRLGWLRTDKGGP